MATPQTISVRQPKHEDAYSVTETSTTTPKAVSTEYAAPSPEVRAQIDAALEPAKKAYGVNPDGSMTPLSVLGYDPAKEAERRQREAELAEFKKKESGWYNGIALAMDAMTAGLGGNVYLRDVNKAKEAEQKQEQLRQEQKAEDAQNAQTMQNAGLSYGKWADAITRSYLSKVKRTSGGETTKTTTHAEKNGYTTRAFSPYVSRSNSSSGGGNGKNGVEKINIRYTVPASKGNPEHVEVRAFDVPKNEFERLGGYLSSVYNEMSAGESEAISKRLQENGIYPKKDGTYDGADLLRSGIVFDDPQIRSEFVRIIDGASDMSAEEKEIFKQAMKTYPSTNEEDTPEKKTMWWEWLMSKLSNSRQDVDSSGWMGAMPSDDDEYDDDWD